jgi:hypothetical protein
MFCILLRFCELEVTEYFALTYNARHHALVACMASLGFSNQQFEIHSGATATACPMGAPPLGLAGSAGRASTGLQPRTEQNLKAVLPLRLSAKRRPLAEH